MITKIEYRNAVNEIERMIYNDKLIQRNNKEQIVELFKKNLEIISEYNEQNS